jgi:hypothetical protein
VKITAKELASVSFHGVEIILNRFSSKEVNLPMSKQSMRHSILARDNKQGENLLLSEDTEAIVAKLAYQLWLQRGSPEGSPEEDWYRAETLLQSGAAVSASSAFPATS